MRFVLKVLAVLAAGIALGLGSVWLVLNSGLPGGVDDGPWRTNLATGSSDAGPYRRALVALHGLFALQSREAIYYTATFDDAGDRLDGRCHYEIAGHDPDARWWSITAYGSDDFLIPNQAHRYSVSQQSVKRDAGGAYTIEIGADNGGPNWIATEPKGRFSLTLRLYEPGKDVLADPAHAVLPTLKRVMCA